MSPSASSPPQPHAVEHLSDALFRSLVTFELRSPHRIILPAPLSNLPLHSRDAFDAKSLRANRHRTTDDLLEIDRALRHVRGSDAQ